MGNKNAKQDKTVLDEKDITLLLENTSFTREQILEWHKGFISDCPTGQLTKKKFIDIYKQFYPSGRAEKFCEHVFRTFDSDCNGFIDFNEFLIAINVTSRGDLKKKLNWAFTMYDIDGNGKIDKKEMKKIIEAIYELLGSTKNPNISLLELSSEKRVEEIFKKIDTNSDNFVSRDEFIDGCLNDEALRKLLAPSA